MNFTRRDALKLAGSAAVALSVPSLAQATNVWHGSDESLYPPGLSPWPVLQGPTDRQSATFILLLPTGTVFSARVLDTENRDRPARIVSRYDIPGNGLSTYEVNVTGLTPRHDYALYLLNEEGGYFDRRLFRSLDTSQSHCRFAALSCMNDFFFRDAITMWESLAREQCDFVVISGDTCYSDQRQRQGSAAPNAERYAETRLALSWFRMERLVPTFAVWDDHDFGTNNGDRTFPLAGPMRDLFRAFWGATDNTVWQQGFGAGSRLNAFGQRFYLLDGRSFRDPPGTLDARHWGDQQLDWMISDIDRNAAPVWVVTGNQIFGRNPIRESVEADQPEDLLRLTNALASQRAPVAFITGDVHFSEINQVDRHWLGYDTYEFTSSSMHSMPNPGFVHQGNIAAERRHNFMVFDVDQNDGWHMRCRSIRNNNIVSFDHSFLIERG